MTTITRIDRKFVKTVFSAFLAVFGAYVLLLIVSVGSLFAQSLDNAWNAWKNYEGVKSISSLSEKDKATLRTWGDKLDSLAESKNITIDSNGLSEEEKGLAALAIKFLNPTKLKDNMVVKLRSTPFSMAEATVAEDITIPIKAGSWVKALQAAFENPTSNTHYFLPSNASYYLKQMNGTAEAPILQIQVDQKSGTEQIRANEQFGDKNNIKTATIDFQLEPGEKANALKAFMNKNANFKLPSRPEPVDRDSLNKHDLKLAVPITTQDSQTVSKDTFGLMIGDKQVLRSKAQATAKELNAANKVGVISSDFIDLLKKFPGRPKGVSSTGGSGSTIDIDQLVNPKSNCQHT